MKIGVSDSTNFKFSQDLIDHWQNIGHEVKAEIGGSEFVAQWADIYWIDWWDNNIHYLYNWYKEHPDAKKPKFIVRAIDWDVWVRGIRSQDMVDFVDCIISIAPHIDSWLRKEKDDNTGLEIQWGNKLRLIRPGVNLEKFTIRDKQSDGFNIGMVLGDMWWMKNHMGGLDIFTTLHRQDPRWKLHIRGQHEPGQYFPVMYKHYLDSRKITEAVTLYPPDQNMPQWYENIDILLHPSFKEAFCYAVAEAAAKGIPIVCNKFYGAREVWPASWLYETHDQAVKMIQDADIWNPQIFRDYIEKNYSNERAYNEIDKLLEELYGTGGN